MKRILPIIILAILIALSGCKKKTSADETGAAVKPVVGVSTSTIIQGEAQVLVNATGKTEALRKQDIVSPITGKLISLKVQDGQAVKSGDVLAVIQSRESQAALEGAQSLLQSAKSERERSDALRMSALAESTQTRVYVRASFNGVISARTATEGQVLLEGAPLLTMVDLSTIIFLADLPLKDLASIKIGQHGQLRLDALPDISLDAVIDAINPQGDAESQSVKIRLRFSDARAIPTLKTGMAGTSHIVIGTHDRALLAPKVAILRNDETNEHSVVIVGSDSLAHIIGVSVGATSDSLMEIVSPQLKAGMNVIVEGHYSLADSTRITVNQRQTQ